MRHYNIAGFSIKRIECDSDFKSIMDKFTDEIGIEINYENPDRHIPEVERNIRMLKEFLNCIISTDI